MAAFSCHSGAISSLTIARLNLVRHLVRSLVVPKVSSPGNQLGRQKCQRQRSSGSWHRPTSANNATSAIRVVVLRLRRARGGVSYDLLRLLHLRFATQNPEAKPADGTRRYQHQRSKTAVPISGNDREFFRLFAVRVLKTQRMTIRSFLHHCLETCCSDAHHYDFRAVALR